MSATFIISFKTSNSFTTIEITKHLKLFNSHCNWEIKLWIDSRRIDVYISHTTCRGQTPSRTRTDITQDQIAT